MGEVHMVCHMATQLSWYLTRSLAELPRDVPVALDAHSPYSQPNETARNELWEAINIDAGMIAVSDSFVEEKDLPESQRFVWDQSKSVYLLNGHHTLHCVVSLAIDP